jgi:hypothetical protein
LSSKKNSYQYTLQFIADLLSFENSIESLHKKMISNTIDWEQFVFVASDYLVLTTCYCRMRQKDLLKYIPNDLELYLEEITSINRNRNITLLKEITRLANILNDHNISYAFLKGSAFLINNYYDDIGERMLGDIDILVDENHIEKAYKLLLENNYRGTEQGISAKYFDHKHLPKLQSDIHLAAVELHKKVTEKSYYDLLDSDTILENKVIKNGMYIPCKKHLVLQTILNFQANDSGYLYSRISLKSIYDLLILKNIYGELHEFNDQFKLPYFKNYFSIAKIFFDDFSSFSSNLVVNNLFLLKLKHRSFRTFIDYLIGQFTFFKLLLTTRIWMFLRNKNYRRDLLKRL